MTNVRVSDLSSQKNRVKPMGAGWDPDALIPFYVVGIKIADILKQGKEVWFYTFFTPRDNSPTWLIDFAPINHRIDQ